MLGISMLGLVLAVPFDGPPQAVDLMRIERQLAAEPAYQAASQDYCLLVFGPAADTRIWLVRDGATLHVDLNGNGRLGEEGESFRAAVGNGWSCWKVDQVTERNGRKHAGFLCQATGNIYDIIIKLDGKVAQRTFRTPWTQRAAIAPIVHFRGPGKLCFQSLCEVTRVPDGQNEVGLGQGGTVERGKLGFLEAQFGTLGLGTAATAYYSLPDQLLANPEEGLQAIFEFPGPDAQFLKVKANLTAFDGVSGVVPIPLDARTGWVRASVTLVNLHPHTVEFNVLIR